MQQFFFLFGNHPSLSCAELLSVLQREGVSYTDFSFQHNHAFFKSDDKNIAGVFQMLGGAVKYGRVIDEVTKEVCTPETLYQLIDKSSRTPSEKYVFGISVYGDGKNSLTSFRKRIFAYGLEIKKLLREHGVHSRLVTSREDTLSSVIVSKNILKKHGDEVVLFLQNDHVIRGCTTSVQDFEHFGNLDFGRPFRDSRSGMLPPKLARIMVNLAALPVTSVINDPFCGSGTIVQEALLAGYTKVYASDKSEKAVVDTRRNIDWLRKDQLQEHEFHLQVDKREVKDLPAHFTPSFFDGFITEPFLGSPQVSSYTFFQMERSMRELLPLYSLSLEVFHTLLKPAGKVVMVWPVFQQEGKRLYLPLVSHIKRLGFSLFPFPGSLPRNDRGAFEYGRLGQTVTRELWVLQKV